MGSNQKTVSPEGPPPQMSQVGCNTHPPPRPPRHASASLSPSATAHDLEAGNRRLSTSSADSRASEVHRDGEVGIDKEQKTKVKIVGRVGFAAKSVIYGVLGALFIRTATGGSEDSSPQGVFVVVGDNNVGVPLLVIMAVSLVFYVMWRWAEAFTGQGSDASFSKKKNFFKYRVSPFVSGAVYAAYTYYVVRTIFTNRDQRRASTGSQTTHSTFPDNVTSSGIAGKIAVGFLGLLFVVAAGIQWQVTYKAFFIRELYANKLRNPYVRNTVHWLGRIGFAARGFLFLLVAVLLFRSIDTRDSDSAEINDPNHSITGKAVSTLANHGWGKVILIIIGVGLLIYSVFAMLNVYYKIFPTPPPTRNPAIDPDDVEKDRKEREDAAAQHDELPQHSQQQQPNERRHHRWNPLHRSK
ncbi:hypothetical protein HDU87_005226 [Geranomyces variabilis]|uniref:DUF1206 domain-containing protein n=1 Tax=Geranomyces variabilis TaxID=109894 RepID=A0AAD5THE7_9FUNG|nr:hypothetical protein HDU87_005226 [Geranomyces variabilis]